MLKSRSFFYKFIIFLKLDYVIGFIGRHSYFNSNIIRIVAKLAPPVNFYSQLDRRKITLCSSQFIVQMNDLMSQPLFFGLYMHEITCLDRHFPKDAVVIDVGANIGRWSLIVSDLFKTKKVFSFEPFKETFTRLSENVKLNPHRDIEIINSALNSKNEFVEMKSQSQFNSGMNFVSKTPAVNLDRSNSIKSITLDYFCLNDRNLSQVSVIKIDVEGFEMNVLQGAIEMIKKFKPTIICEVDDSLLKKNGYSPADLFELLKGVNYSIKILPNFRPLDLSSDCENIHFDIFAHPDSLINEKGRIP